MHRFATSVVAVAIIIAFSVAPALHAQTVARELDRYIQQAVAEWGVPGVAVGVVKDDKLVFAKGYGVRAVGAPEKVDARTIFGIASNTKAFAAASIAILVDEGKLRWDDRVIDHLPSLRLHDAYATRELRVRDLLSQRNGLPPYGGDIMTWGSSYPREQILERIRHVPPVSSFRSEYAYQNGMFIAAGELVEAVTGTAWDEFVSERLFEPLGMSATTTSFAVAMRNANVAMPHMYVDGKHERIPWRNIENLGAAAAINSDVEDLAQWVRLQLGRGELEGKRIFSEQVAHEMWSPQTIIRLAPAEQQAPPAAKWSAYALGWTVRDYHGRRIIRHGGWTDGMLSTVAMMPEENLGVIVLTNSHNRNITSAILYRILDAYIGVKPTDWSATFLSRTREAEARAAKRAVEREQKRAKGTRPSLPLERYAGTYSNEVYGDVLVAHVDGKLTIDFTASPTFKGELVHWHYDTFESKWHERIPDSAPVVFTLDEEGTVRELRTTLGDFIEPQEYTFTRTPPER